MDPDGRLGHIAGGAIAGAAGGGVIYLAKAAITGEFSLRGLGAAVAGGAVFGALFAATGGASLAAQGMVAQGTMSAGRAALGEASGLALSGMSGGFAERAIGTGSLSKTADPMAQAWDAAGAMGGTAAVKLAAKVVQKFAPVVKAGIARARQFLGRGGEAILDTNALIAAVEKGQASRILAGRSPVVPIAVAKEFLRGGGSSEVLRKFLARSGGRLATAGAERAVIALQQQAAGLGRVLHVEDARVVAGAIEEGLPLVTNDKRLGGFLQASGVPFERF